jgi:hypothetical protein
VCAIDVVHAASMKTTVDIPDELMRRMQSEAAARSVPLRQWIVEALEERLRTAPSSSWRDHVGALREVGALHED